MFRKTLDLGEAGDNIGALLRGINRDQVERGQVLAKPGSIQTHRLDKEKIKKILVGGQRWHDMGFRLEIAGFDPGQMR